MKKISALFLSLGLLAGCSTILTNQTQLVTIKTPGASEAECVLHNEAMRYRVQPNVETRIMKSNRDLIVDCFASGNRQRTLIVETQLEPMALANVSNAVVPGVTYDHYSRGLYTYPEIITVDFTNVKPKTYALPGYMSDDVRGVYHGTTENYGSSVLALPGEEYEVQPMIQKRNWSTAITGSPFERAPETGGSRPLVPVTEK